MKKYFLSAVAGAIICAMILSTSHAADRDALIAQNLDCMEKFYDAGPVTARNVCAPEASRSSVKVTTDPIIVAIQPTASGEPKDPEALPQSRESSLSYQYFNFHENPLNEFSLATEVFDYTYEEPDIMRDKGTMLGIHGVYTHRWRLNDEITGFNEVFADNGINVLRVDMRYAFDNNMQYESNGTGDLKGEKHFFVDTRAVFGYDFPYKQKHLFTPYAGVGYWVLKDHDGRKLTTTGHSSYNRKQEYVYLPLGIDYVQMLDKGLSVSLNLEYDYLIKGTNKTFAEGLAFVGWDSNVYLFPQNGAHDQQSGRGYRGSVKVAKEMGSVEFFVEPFFLLWHIKESDVLYWKNSSGTIVSGTVEPDNRTQQYGLKMGVNF